MPVSRIRRSRHCAASSLANFGFQGTLETDDSGAVLVRKFSLRTRGNNEENFRTTARAEENSFLGDFDRNFRAVGLRKPRLVLEAGGYRAVADLMCVAVLVEFKQLGRQRFAAGVALA